MVLNKKDINRLVIYFFYDADGVVDRYVPCILEEMKKNSSEIFVVVNGKLTLEGRETFKKITPKVFVRENVGFDVWAYKEAMEQYGWEKLSEFDEVVLMNHTILGPLYPFCDMFEEMNKRDLDFWGITKHHGFEFDPFGTIECGYIPEHIQSSFICIRSSMLNSIEFHKYWEKMQMITSYGEAVGKHEAIFTKKFKDYGYKSAVYIETDDLKEFTHYPLMLTSLELVKNRRCPIFKRKAFSNEYYEFLNATLGEPTVELFDYITKNLDYDINMVWENLLRVDNMADIKNRMHLNYVLPKDTINYPNSTPKEKIALVMHIYFEDCIDYCINYAKSMPENADVFITTCDKKNVDLIQTASKALAPRKVTVMKIENRGRDVSSLLVGVADYVSYYDLICFAHDKKSTQMKPLSVGESFSYKCFENVLGSKEYVRNIISKFEMEPKLGMMMPPPPNHAGYYGILGTEWGGNFYNTFKLAKELELKVNLNEIKEPIAPLGTMFWFRPKALEPLFKHKFKFTDFPTEPNKYDGTILHAIERIYGFVVQSQGYYPAWCMHDKFAAIEITNYHFMMREVTMAIHSTLGHQPLFNMAGYNLKNQLSTRKIIKQKFKKILPKPIWNFLKKIYHALGGKKWVG